MKYCSVCGSTVEISIPAGDNRPRHICVECETIHYQNPKIVAGCLPVQGSRVLLCKRAIDPQYGKWTLPAGFMENGESLEEAAMRESIEEANASLETLRLYTVISLPHINQVYMMFLADLTDADYSPEQRASTSDCLKKRRYPGTRLLSRPSPTHLKPTSSTERPVYFLSTPASLPGRTANGSR